MKCIHTLITLIKLIKLSTLIAFITFITLIALIALITLITYIQTQTQTQTGRQADRQNYIHRSPLFVSRCCINKPQHSFLTLVFPAFLSSFCLDKRVNSSPLVCTENTIRLGDHQHRKGCHSNPLLGCGAAVHLSAGCTLGDEGRGRQWPFLACPKTEESWIEPSKTGIEYSLI